MKLLDSSIKLESLSLCFCSFWCASNYHLSCSCGEGGQRQKTGSSCASARFLNGGTTCHWFALLIIPIPILINPRGCTPPLEDKRWWRCLNYSCHLKSNGSLALILVNWKSSTGTLRCQLLFSLFAILPHVWHLLFSNNQSLPDHDTANWRRKARMLRCIMKNRLAHLTMHWDSAIQLKNSKINYVLVFEYCYAGQSHRVCHRH